MHSEDDESHEGLLREKTGAWEDIVVQQQFKHTRDVLIPWVLSIFFFCTTILFAWQSRTSPITQTCSNGNVNGTYGTGFSTDFGIALATHFLNHSCLIAISIFLTPHPPQSHQETIHQRPPLQCHLPRIIQRTSRPKRSHLHRPSIALNRRSMA